MDSLKPIPRAIYYMSPLQSLKSIWHLYNLKSDEKVIKKFEHEFSLFVGSKHSLSTSHARVALYTILSTMKFSPGDEILMSPINLPDMINMVRLNGLQPRFFDYQKHSFNFDIEDLSSKISDKTKILFLTLLTGIENNIDEVISLAKERNIILICDQTQAMGQMIKNHPLANQIDFSIYSLCDLKDIHTHRGAMISYNDDKYS